SRGTGRPVAYPAVDPGVRHAHHRRVPVAAAAPAGPPSAEQASLGPDQELPPTADHGKPAVRLPAGRLAAAVRFAGFRLAVPRRPVRAASGAQDAAFGLRLDRFRPVAMGSPPARLARLQGHSLDPRRILPADAGV